MWLHSIGPLRELVHPRSFTGAGRRDVRLDGQRDGTLRCIRAEVGRSANTLLPQ